MLSVLGVVAGLLSAEFFAVRPKPNPPVFTPAANPYEHGVYANGIIESEQASGENINVFPEVSGTVTEIAVHEGQTVRRGARLVHIEESVQRATAAQLTAQAAAALALLEELRAQPRPENLQIAVSQVGAARATLKTASDQLAKQRASYAADPRSVSKLVLDDARLALCTSRA